MPTIDLRKINVSRNLEISKDMLEKLRKNVRNKGLTYNQVLNIVPPTQKTQAEHKAASMLLKGVRNRYEKALENALKGPKI